MPWKFASCSVVVVTHKKCKDQQIVEIVFPKTSGNWGMQFSSVGNPKQEGVKTLECNLLWFNARRLGKPLPLINSLSLHQECIIVLGYVL